MVRMEVAVALAILTFLVITVVNLVTLAQGWRDVRQPHT